MLFFSLCRKALVLVLLGSAVFSVSSLPFAPVAVAKESKAKKAKGKAAKSSKKKRAHAAPVDKGEALYADIVIDAKTGRVLHATNASGERHPASLTKMMTLYLTFQALDSGKIGLEDRLPVSSLAASQSPTKLGLRAGQSIRVRDAVLGLVTVSANDAAVVLAEGLGGSISRFAEIMTQQARALGMRSTVFNNPNGLPDPEQVTTARDMATLGRALIYHYPRYYPFFSQESYVYAGVERHNHNHLMERYTGMDGIKTGYVRTSGFNLVASAERNGRRLIGVVFGGRSAPRRDAQMAALLDAAFEDADGQPVGQGDAEVESLPYPPKVSIAFRSSKTTAEAGVGDWAIQIGAFADQDQAQAVLASVSRKTGPLLRPATPSVEPIADQNGKTLYRARFSGIEERMARSVCAYLVKHGQSCMIVAP